MEECTSFPGPTDAFKDEGPCVNVGSGFSGTDRHYSASTVTGSGYNLVNIFRFNVRHHVVSAGASRPAFLSPLFYCLVLEIYLAGVRYSSSIWGQGWDKDGRWVGLAVGRNGRFWAGCGREGLASRWSRGVTEKNKDSFGSRDHIAAAIPSYAQSMFHSGMRPSALT
ncbi:hypothetical protein PM082_012487 [Marasmius tenuissimus]|nr:hypothetical protein PM082_012487 [Marasmius tenuissimus]